MCIDDVTEILDFLSCKLALAEVCIEVVLLEDLEDRLEVCQVFLTCFAEDEDVIQIDDNKAVKDGLEDRVHEVLEHGWGIAETKGHDEELVVAISRLKCRFWDVLVFDADLPVART